VRGREASRSIGLSNLEAERFTAIWRPVCFGAQLTVCNIDTGAAAGEIEDGRDRVSGTGVPGVAMSKLSFYDPIGTAVMLFGVVFVVAILALGF
jgi:hypothetical protein